MPRSKKSKKQNQQSFDQSIQSKSQIRQFQYPLNYKAQQMSSQSQKINQEQSEFNISQKQLENIIKGDEAHVKIQISNDKESGFFQEEKAATKPSKKKTGSQKRKRAAMRRPQDQQNVNVLQEANPETIREKMATVDNLIYFDACRIRTRDILAIDIMKKQIEENKHDMEKHMKLLNQLSQYRYEEEKQANQPVWNLIESVSKDNKFQFNTKDKYEYKNPFMIKEIEQRGRTFTCEQSINFFMERFGYGNKENNKDKIIYCFGMCLRNCITDVFDSKFYHEFQPDSLPRNVKSLAMRYTEMKDKKYKIFTSKEFNKLLVAYCLWLYNTSATNDCVMVLGKTFIDQFGDLNLTENEKQNVLTSDRPVDEQGSYYKSQKQMRKAQKRRQRKKKKGAQTKQKSNESKSLGKKRQSSLKRHVDDDQYQQKPKIQTIAAEQKRQTKPINVVDQPEPRIIKSRNDSYDLAQYLDQEDELIENMNNFQLQEKIKTEQQPDEYLLCDQDQRQQTNRVPQPKGLINNNNAQKKSFIQVSKNQSKEKQRKTNAYKKPVKNISQKSLQQSSSATTTKVQPTTGDQRFRKSQSTSQMFSHSEVPSMLSNMHNNPSIKQSPMITKSFEKMINESSEWINQSFSDKLSSNQRKNEWKNYSEYDYSHDGQWEDFYQQMDYQGQGYGMQKEVLKKEKKQKKQKSFKKKYYNEDDDNEMDYEYF